MPYKIEEIQGIGAAFAEKLTLAEIKTTSDLLKACADPGGRQRVAATTGLSETQLLKWSNMADLMRISGIGPQYAELLEATGVDTVKELRRRNPENLVRQLQAINSARKLTGSLPASAVVEGWITQARTTEPSILY